MTDAARRAFIAAHTGIEAPSLVPELRLHLATEVSPLWHATEAFLQESGVAPPFWAFAWAGGQALARHVLDHPETVRGRSVLDVASGGGVVGLAAARAGARHVVCADVDPFAATAVLMNAALNGLESVVEARCADVTATLADDAPGSVILAGDVCYEQPMAARVLAFLQGRVTAGARVLLGDPGRAYVPAAGVEALAVYDVPTTLDLEDRDVRRTTVWGLMPPGP